MKLYIKASEDNKLWQNMLPEDVHDRLSYCTSKKQDIVPLASAYYNYSKRAKEDNWTPEDCVVYMLEWVLDWNGGLWDYTDREFNRWVAQVQRSKRTTK